MEKPSWVCTLSIQIFLCLTLFLAFNFNISQFQNKSDDNSRSIDLYFITVRGGFRSLKHQTHLLKQMEKVVKAYKVKFVVNISQLGENDPLTQNGTLQFQSLKVPWYTIGAPQRQRVGYFLKQTEIAYGNNLDIIGLNTGSSQGSSSGIGKTQLQWLTRTLEATNSNWRIVVGFHPLAVSEESNEQMEGNQVSEPLHCTFLKFGVNLYLSSQGFANHAYQGGIAYVGNPGPINDGQYFSSVNESSVLNREMVNGFLLHRVSSLEIVTYFVTSAGEVMHKTVLQQRGREVM